ncbi:NAD-dependent epimerase/dehydratase family protein [Natronobacterium gregoryi]|uniref:NAD dependent epimerase/dehydratase family protein n=2 Tax=Natronobacterium gregoryi TaxID=44930 RepID=L0AKD8_NATGS|nr:NAD(P)-dependent oxidoreductase [Natronobacterium gregoryi]AFZ73617.1 NAD dependent epimerase/dehydratase family protein [Natronobacterium gregoryi SP2]ELY67900.1 NAD-dependent epimerase/dehydratase [Natronobacterium gregoryi SP2]PLK19993.1 NAD(P)-dependent oxidoreductase [Natronobacterium gregoryi SP2]SFJ34177.1 L-arabinose 1-dehydrogenase [NAD(P)+] [Natronobacterium gregoryi]
MTDVAITGASGRVGRETIEALSDEGFELTLFSHSETDDLETTTLEVADYEAVVDALVGQDVVVHLAANPDPRAEWRSVREPNIDGAYNVYEAAAETGVERVVFASSNHAVNMDNAVSGDRPESTVDEPDVVRPGDVADPDTYYGVTKAFGEALGSYYAKRHGIDVVALRIGWLLTRDELRSEIEDRDDAGERYARAMWLSPADCQRLMAAAVTVPLEQTLTTAHGISNNTRRFLSLTETMIELGYRPRDDSADVLEGDGGRQGSLETG